MKRMITILAVSIAMTSFTGPALATEHGEVGKVISKQEQ